MIAGWSRSVFLAVALCCVSSGTLHAQAFTQPAGEGRIITTGIYTTSGEAFDDSSTAKKIPNYNIAEVYIQGEYGVTDDLTLLATPSLRSVSIDGGGSKTGLGYTELGGRYRVLHKDNVVFSFQATARIPGQTDRNSLAQIGQTDAEYDFRGQLGVTFGKGSFVILETGYRLRAGDPPNEFHVDATVGVRATQKLMFTLNSFNVISDGGGRDIFVQPYRYHNLFVGGVYDISKHVSVQLGFTGTIAGRNALRERGGFASVWTRF